MFEVVQHRAIYGDHVPHEKLPLTMRHGDWRMAHKRIAREFPDITTAERYARKILAQRPGCPVEIFRVHGSGDRRVAMVSRDALGRTWTDVLVAEPLL